MLKPQTKQEALSYVYWNHWLHKFSNLFWGVIFHLRQAKSVHSIIIHWFTDVWFRFVDTITSMKDCAQKAYSTRQSSQHFLGLRDSVYIKIRWLAFSLLHLLQPHPIEYAYMHDADIFTMIVNALTYFRNPFQFSISSKSVSWEYDYRNYFNIIFLKYLIIQRLWQMD